MICPNCGSQQSDKNQKCLKCNHELKSDFSAVKSSESGTPAANTTDAELPMKWFKFLIYFSLFFGALVNAVTAYQYLNKTMTYHLFGEYFRLLDIVYGMSLFVIAVLMVIVRFRLSGFKKDAPIFFCSLCILSIFLSAAYIVAAINTIKFYPYIPYELRTYYIKTLTISSAISMSLYVIFVALNIKYFFKRRHLFCK